MTIPVAVRHPLVVGFAAALVWSIAHALGYGSAAAYGVVISAIAVPPDLRRLPGPLFVVLPLLCAVALAVYWLLGESGQEHRDAVSLTMWGFVFASLAWAVISPWWDFPWEVLTIDAEPLVDGSTGLPIWSLMTWGILMGTIVPFLLVLGSLRRIGAQRAGIVGTTEPLWAGLIGFLLLGETFAGAQIIGGLIVLAGVVVAETSRRSGVAVTPGEFPQIREG